MNIIKKRDKKLDAALSGYLAKNPNIHRGISTVRIEEIYHQMVGDVISRYTEKVYITKKGELHIYVTSAPLKIELLSQKKQLIILLNEALGSEIITDLRIK
ncbi:MAG TPA: DciA family protein [Saprospiraceae bacterium]|nr:DciA family protein [Saprospiraceae bacterium]HPN72340.1 DciA family protein [Saprospiraceae bacterium]